MGIERERVMEVTLRQILVAVEGAPGGKLSDEQITALRVCVAAAVATDLEAHLEDHALAFWFECGGSMEEARDTASWWARVRYQRLLTGTDDDAETASLRGAGWGVNPDSQGV
jgi:hypothetical protein